MGSATPARTEFSVSDGASMQEDVRRDTRDWCRKWFGAITVIALWFDPKWLVNKLFRSDQHHGVRANAGTSSRRRTCDAGRASLWNCRPVRCRTAGPNRGALFSTLPADDDVHREPAPAAWETVDRAGAGRRPRGDRRSGAFLPTSADRKSLRVTLWPTTVSLFCIPPAQAAESRSTITSSLHRWPPACCTPAARTRRVNAVTCPLSLPHRPAPRVCQFLAVGSDATTQVDLMVARTGRTVRCPRP